MQREKGAPLMQNDVWRASKRAALCWMRSGGSRKRPGKRISVIKRGKKERREEERLKLSPSPLASQTADTKGNIALINSLFKQG